MRLNITMFLRLSNFAWGRHLHSSLHGIGNLSGKEQLKIKWRYMIKEYMELETRQPVIDRRPAANVV